MSLNFNLEAWALQFATSTITPAEAGEAHRIYFVDSQSRPVSIAVPAVANRTVQELINTIVAAAPATHRPYVTNESILFFTIGGSTPSIGSTSTLPAEGAKLESISNGTLAVGAATAGFAIGKLLTN